jgi:hypothetical protein
MDNEGCVGEGNGAVGEPGLIERDEPDVKVGVGRVGGG